MRFIAIVFCATLILFSFSQVQATIIHVPGDSSTIQGGINGAVKGDTIPFAPPVHYDVVGDPRGIFCADLDGDMDIDLAVAGYYDNFVSVLRNNGDGTFQSAVPYEVGDWPYSVFCADLDGDLDLDLAVPNHYSDSVSILKNNGDGTFQPATSYEAGYRPKQVFCADLDGDEDLDVVVSVDGYVSVLKNYGDGTFEPPDHISVGPGSPVSVFCADLDGDQDSDLATANGGPDSVSILKNNGDATFEPPVHYGLVEGGQHVFCADLDGDLDLDLAVALSYTPSGSVSILKNNGDGSFQDAVPYEAGYTYVVFAVDLDGDQDLDLAVSSLSPNGFGILRNNGDGTFSPLVNYPSAQGPCFYVSCADMDMDGDVDIVASHANTYNVSICLNLINSRPQPYALLLPSNLDSLSNPTVNFSWEDAVDPNPDDTVFYTLFLSNSVAFHPDSTVTCENLLQSEYTDSLEVGSYYWKVKAHDTWGAVRWSEETWNFCLFSHGDANGDWIINIADVVRLINFLFRGGPPPTVFAAGDANCDGYVTVGDIVYLVNYLFKGGPPPCEP